LIEHEAAEDLFLGDVALDAVVSYNPTTVSGGRSNHGDEVLAFRA
jgi:hypothetical protein